jgi:hypothetical protein
MENMKERDHLEYLGLGGKVILKWILKDIGWEGMDQINVAWDRNKWQALVNMEMNNFKIIYSMHFESIFFSFNVPTKCTYST